MLVLSRGLNDKVVFPTLGISIDIIRVSGNKVRLGIDAPKEIPVYRQEIAERMQASGEDLASLKARPRELGHAIRNRLNAASLGLHLLHRKLEIGKTADAEASIFAIFNELKAIEDELQPRTPAREPANATEGRRALVVEDDANERQLLSGYLEMSGFEVDTAVDGLQAMVKLTQEERPDVVLLDMKMPRFDGKSTVTAIRRNPDYSGLKVFGVSGEQPAKLNISIGQGGVDRWFSKPLNPQELVSAIHEELSTESVSA